MKLKFALKFKTVAHIESQKQPSKQKYKISVLFLQESVLFKHVASKIFWKNKSKKQIFFRNCLFDCFWTVDKAREKIINDSVKLPIILKLFIKNKDNTASEYCFNKDFFITVLSMLSICQLTQQSTTQYQHRWKNKIKKT